MITPEQLARSGTEHGHQTALFCWAAQSGIVELKWLFAIPNGFYGDSGQKGKMKAEGLKNGVCDIFLPVTQSKGHTWGDRWNGLFIEMKHSKHRSAKSGGLNDEQIEFITFVEKQGYKVALCYSWEQARDAILKYLGKI